MPSHYMLSGCGICAGSEEVGFSGIIKSEIRLGITH